MYTCQKKTCGLQPASTSTIVLFHSARKFFKTEICLPAQPREPDSCVRKQQCDLVWESAWAARAKGEFYISFGFGAVSGYFYFILDLFWLL